MNKAEIAKITGSGWAPVNDGERMIATDHVGATESQARKSFLAGWPGGWKQARLAGWRMARVIITAASPQIVRADAITPSDLPIRTCPKCGSKAVIFICSE